MGCVININGLATTSRNVPFGVSVSLTNSDQVDVTSQTWEVLSYPRDVNGTPPDFATNFAAWTVQPNLTYRIIQPGPSPFAAVVFTPDVTGTYLVKLSCATSSGTLTQTAIVRVADVYTAEYVPAAGESVEAGTLEGWAKERNRSIKYLSRRVAKGTFVRVANQSGSSIARGRVVRVTDFADAHGITPNAVPGGSTVLPERIPLVVLGNASDAGASTYRYLVLDETIANNGTGLAQMAGVFEGSSDVDYSGFTAGAPIYVSNTGTQSPTPGTTALVIGHVVKASAATGAALLQMATTSTVDVNYGNFPVLTFFIDNDNGNDANDGLTSSTPVKTFDLGLDPKIPTDGKGGFLIIRCLPRAGSAAYLRSDASNEQLTTLQRLVNYRSITVQGDWFNASSVPVSGGVPATGTNSAGYDVTGTPTTTTFTVTLHGGGAPALSAEPALIGYWWRWDAATTTVALRNLRRMVIANTGTTVTMATPFATAPTAGDWGHIEMPGLTIGSGTTLTIASSGLTLSGMSVNGNVTIFGSTPSVSLSSFHSSGIIGLNQVRTLSVTLSRLTNTLTSLGTIGTTAIGTSRIGTLNVDTGGPFSVNTFYANRINVLGNAARQLSGSEDTLAQMNIGDAPGSTNTPSRLVTTASLSGKIVASYSDLRISGVNFEDNFGTTGTYYAVKFIGNGNTVYIDGLTTNNSTFGVSGIIDMQEDYGAVNVVGPSKGNTIIFGPNQTIMAVDTKSNLTADIHLSMMSPLDGTFQPGAAVYTLMFDTLRYVGAVVDGSGNKYVSYSGRGLSQVRVTAGLWDSNPTPPFPVVNDLGRFRVVRAKTALPGQVDLADNSSVAGAANIVGVNIASMPSGTGYDRTGAPLIVTEGYVPIITQDSSPTVPGPVWLSPAYPRGLVTTVKPASNAVMVGTAVEDLGAWNETTQTPVAPNPATVTGRLLRVMLGPLNTTIGGDLSGTPGTANVIGLLETGGPTHLTYGAIAIGDLLTRVGTTVVGTAATGFVPSTRAVTGTAPISIAGDHAAHDLSTNRTWSLDANGITDAFIRQGGATSVIGRSANSTGNVADLSASADGDVLWRNGTTLGFAALPYSKLTGTPAAITSLTTDVVATGPGAAAATIQPGVVTNAKLANMATARFKARITSGTGDPEDLTGTQATTLLDVFTSSLKGLAPSSGGGATNFLRADGTWAVPAGTAVTQLTGDVTAGPGSGSVVATLVNIPTGTTMAGLVLATAIAAPATPAAGIGAIYVDSTSKNLAVRDDAGIVKHGVQTRAAVTSNFVTGISDAGVVSVAQPAYSDISGAPADLSAVHFLTDRSEALLSNEVNLGGQAASGVQQTVISGGVATFNTFAVSSTRIPHGSGSNGALTDSANLIYASSTLTVTGTTPLVLGSGATGIKTSLRDPDSIGNFAQVWFYPNSGTNVAQAFAIMPRGTGFSSTNKAQFAVYNHDPIANPSAYEFFSMRAVGASGFIFGTGTVGLSHRDMMFACGWMSDGATNDGQLLLKANGDVIFGVGLATSATARFLYIPSSAGVPTGASTGYSGGAVVPIQTDRTNKRLYVNTPGSSTWEPYAQFTGGLATGLLKNTTSTGLWTIASAGSDYESPLTFSSPLSRSTNTVGLVTPNGGRVLAGNSGGTGFDASDEVRVNTTLDTLAIGSSGALAMPNGVAIIGANYDQVRARWISNVWTLKSEKGGSGTVRSMSITADTADLTLTGAHVNLVGSTQIPTGGQFAIYNVDGSDYERARSFWSANVYTIKTEATGAGVVRPMLLDGSEVRVATLTAGGLVYTSVGSTGQLLNMDFGGNATKHDFFTQNWNVNDASAVTGKWLVTSSTTPISTAMEYPNDFLAGHALLLINLIAQTGVSSTVTCSVTRNGTIISGSDVTFLVGTTGNGVIVGTRVVTGSGSSSDTYGLFIQGSNPSTGATATFSAQVVLTP